MKLYLHELISDNNVITLEKEAEEKPKTYFVQGRYNFVTRVNKSDINKLQGRWCYFMYTLEPDVNRFIDAVIEALDRSIKAKEESLQRAREQKEKLAARKIFERMFETDGDN